MKSLIFVSISMFLSASAFAHGKLEWIHCSDKSGKNTVVINSEKEDGKYESKIIAVQNGKITFEKDDLEATLKDTVKGQKVFDTFTVEMSKKDELVISVDEAVKGDSKPATAKVKISKINMDTDMTCSALY